MQSYRTRHSGFTLVEILIVVIILGILAAIVIPQFTNASQDARCSGLASTVQTMRSQIELYKLQHQDSLPDLVTDWTPMTVKADGFGPYMQSIPVNQMVPTAAASVVQDATAAGATLDGTVGFVYDLTGGSGKFWGVQKLEDGSYALIGD